MISLQLKIQFEKSSSHCQEELGKPLAIRRLTNNEAHSLSHILSQADLVWPFLESAEITIKIIVTVLIRLLSHIYRILWFCN